MASRPRNCPFRHNTEACSTQPALCLHETFMELFMMVANYLFPLCHQGHDTTTVLDTYISYAGLLPVAFRKKIKCQASG